MCGINGFLQFNRELNKDEMKYLIHKMNDKIIHRGPNEDGTYIGDNIALGMRRLSIIDLSTGKQPIFNEDQSIVIVFNGEIYNFCEIRKTLIDKGHVFTTKSDTEVVLHAYEEYDVECLKLFDGMFAFAIYDIKKGKIFIGRDRAGEKPLYFYKDPNKIIFGSEIKSLLETGFIRKEINKNALTQYLQLTFIPAPLTIYENINKLEAGCYMLISCTGEVCINRYWDMNVNSDDMISDYGQCKKLLREALFASVEKRMISDVPLGAFLSGGIDSTIIVGIMSELASRPIDTFTIGFKEKQYDESARAQIVADHYKTNHHVFYLDFDEAYSQLSSILTNLDEPFADSSAIPTFMVSKFAREFVKVVLTGDSGDELFGGYSKYLIGYYSKKYNHIPRFIREKIIKKCIYSLPDMNSATRKIRKVIENNDKELFQQRKDLMTLGFKSEEMELLLKNDSIYTDSLEFIKQYYDKYAGSADELSQTLYTDFKVVLEGDMLVKVDRMSMLNSIETRVPMLGKEVMELAFKTPSEYKINTNNQKIILKDTFKDLIPQKLLQATKKGFGVPIDTWFRGPLKEKLCTLLSRDFIEQQSLFNYQYISRLLEEHLTGKRNRKSELWVLFVFQNWYKDNFHVG